MGVASAAYDHDIRHNNNLVQGEVQCRASSRNTGIPLATIQRLHTSGFICSDSDDTVEHLIYTGREMSLWVILHRRQRALGLPFSIDVLKTFSHT